MSSTGTDLAVSGTLRGDGFLLSPQQERLWRLEVSGGGAYRAIAAVKIGGMLDPALLRSALRRVVERHEILRTVFVPPTEGEPAFQVITPELTEVVYEDLGEGDPRGERLAAIRRAIWDAPFDLAAGPVLRAALVRLQPDLHLLLLATPSLCADSATLSRLLLELSALYGAAAGSPAIEEEPLQYADYASWQRELLAAGDTELGRAHWQRLDLDGRIDFDLPFPRRAQTGPFAPRLRSARLPSAALSDLRRLASGGALEPVLVALWQTLWWRLTGRRELAMGVAFSGRRLADTQGGFGPYARHLPVSSVVRPELPLSELITAEAETLAKSAKWQDYFSWDLLRPALAGDAAWRLGFELLERREIVHGGRTFRLVESEAHLDRFDFKLVASLDDHGLSLGLQYDSAAFEARDAATVLRRALALIASAAGRPEALLGDLDVLAEAERHQVVREWNPGLAGAAAERCLHEVVQAQVQSAPDGIAVRLGEESLTYAELDARADRLAARLSASGAGGAGPETIVAVALPRSLHLIVAFLGVLKSGAAYLPIDIDAPYDRQAFLLRDSGAVVLVTEESLEDSLPRIVRRVVLLDGGPAPAARPAARPPRASGPGGLAYALYTSGPAGQPQAVLVSHAAIVSILRGTQAELGLGCGDVWTMVHPASSDAAVWEIWGALSSGGQLVMVPDGLARSPEALLGLLDSAGVTVLNLAPSSFRRLDRTDEALAVERQQEGGGGAALSALRLVLLGGEALEPAALAGWLERRSARPLLFNLYGSAETTAHATARRIAAEDALARRGSLLGHALPGLAVHLLAEGFQLASPGVAGEIHVGGAGVARGYLGHPGLTAEKFVPDPFSPVPGSRLYRSGDLARRVWQGAGSDLEYLGRLDRQVKVRGVRIELGEIEAALLGHPELRAAVAVAAPDAQGELRIVAYVVPVPGASLSEEDLFRFLASRLPEPMLPGAWMILDSLPTTAEGKIDRRRLPAPPEENPVSAIGDREDPAGELVRQVFADVLRLPSVEPSASFFHVGGHSLLATQVVSRLREIFGVEVPLRTFFAHPSPAALAEWIRAHRHESRPAGSVPPLVAGPRPAAPPLSFAQERLWFLSEFEPEDPAYNVPVALGLRGDLALSHVHRAIREVVRRHEVLRTRYVSRDGIPFQVVDPPAPFVIPTVDLSGLTETVREEQRSQLARQEAARPFDLEKGPVLRVSFVRLEPAFHMMLATLHHIASDAWSIQILVQEIIALYSAYGSGQPSPLPDPPVQYVDYALWQRTWLAGEQQKSELDFWRGQLSGATRLELPTDRPRGAQASARLAVQPFAVPAALSEELRRISRQEAVTPFMLFLAGFSALLGRHGGQPEVSVGTPIAGRNHLAVERLMGLFVNTLVLRTALPGDLTLAGLVGRVRDLALEAFAHQDLPFEKIVEELQPERNRHRTPLFQAFFTFLNVRHRAQRASIPGLLVQELRSSPGAAKFEVSLSMGEQAEVFGGSFEYMAELFDPTTVARWAGRLLRLLAEMASRPHARLDSVPWLGGSERHQLLVEANDTAVRAARVEPRLHGLVAAWCALTPEAPAVLGAGASLSYGELGRRVAVLARALRRRGVAAETVVGVIAHNEPSLVVTLLAVLEAGGAFLPLDLSYPAERLAFMLADARVRLVVGPEPLLARLPTAAAGWETLDAESPGDAEGGEPAPGEPVAAANLAYVMYTSGSTGQPKAVGVEHRSASWYARTAGARLNIRPGSRVLRFGSLSFDISFEQIFCCLARGGTLVLGREEAQSSAVEFWAQSRAWQISMLSAATAFWHELALEAERRPGSVGPSLKTMVVGGERVLPERVRSWLRHAGPGVELLNTYGPTETTVVALTHSLKSPADAPPPGLEVPIGRPLPGARAYVLDEAGGVLPIGVPGELALAGAGVTRGYLHRPDLTAERFLPDPSGALYGEPGSRLYRTGDLARWRPDGSFEYLGRIDHQVKVRGFRVEPGEVEAALSRHPAVAEAVVVAEALRSGGARLAACWVAREGEPAPSDADLRGFLTDRLPPHLVPSSFLRLAELPRTAVGKIDRRALAREVASRRQAGSDDLVEAGGGRGGPPTGDVELRLAEIWQDLLGARPRGVEDSFFDLGGHSLLATQLLSRISESFGVTVPLRRLFDHPTVAGLAAAVADPAGAVEETAGAIPKAPQGGDLPLSFAQERLWFLAQLEPDNPAYNIPVARRFHGELDLDLLRRAFEELVRRHEILRTRYASRDGVPVQVVDPPPPALPVGVVDLSGLDAALRDRQLLRLAEEEAVRPFDLAAGPVLRLTFVRLAATDHALLATLHHIATDGWSVPLMVQEVVALYAAGVRGELEPLAELPVQYADFAHWQRQWLRGERLGGEIEFWRRQLAGAPAWLELPTDRPRSAALTARSGSRSFLLPKELSRELHGIGRQEGMTPFMVLSAGFALLLGRQAGQPDLTIGTPIAGRNHLALERLIGLFVNTLVLRIALRGELSLLSYLRQVRDVVLDAFAHQELPFERVVEELQPERDRHRTPLFQAFFTFQNQQVQKSRLPGLEITQLGARLGVAKFEVSLSMGERDEAFAGVFEYMAELFDETTVLRWAGRLERLLLALASRPETRLDSVPWLGEVERQQLLVEPRATPFAGSLGAAARLHDLVAVWSAATPDAPAVLAESGRLHYGELDRQARRLARRLRRLGVGPETVVGVLGHNEPSLVVAQLGVLQAGGAFLPLDLSYPTARLAYMLEDAGVTVVVGPRALLAGRDAGAVTLLALEDTAEEADVDVVAGESDRATAENLAYMMYTSGSTGQPKGVAIPHRSAAWFADMAGARLGIGPGVRVLRSGSLSFDLSFGQIFGCLAHGGTVVLGREEAQSSPVDFWAECRAWRIGVLVPATALWHELAAAVEAQPEIVAPSLRKVLFAGERALPERVAGWLRHAGPHAGPEVELVNAYGPTETTVVVLAHAMRSASDAPPPGLEVPIGRPLPGVRAYVFDLGGRALPMGVPGELAIGGPGVARGYQRRPDWTADRFRPDPYGTLDGEAGGRLYRTGDLARFRADGSLEYLGRIDHQVKIRGFRVEPGEVEAALRQHPVVADAVVLVDESAAAGARLVACWVAREGAAESSGASLRAFLAERLPPYLVPAFYFLFDRLPLTPVGKLDRRALGQAMEKRLRSGGGPGPEAGPGQGGPPRDGLELQIGQIWEELLGLRRFGIADSFFDLGGHSLLAIRLIARLEVAFGRRLAVATLFEAPTIEHLAALLRREVPGSYAPGMVALEHRGTKPPLFWAHPVGGSVFCYFNLSRHLGPEQPFYAFQAAGLEGEETPAADVETMAARYLAQVRELQPRGPYRLGGWSMGGVIAFEMACQLAAAGETVAQLALVDSFAPGARRRESTERELLLGFARELGLGPADLRQGVRPLAPLQPDASGTDLLPGLLARAQAAGVLPADLPPGLLARHWSVYRSHVESLRRYRPQPYPGAALLLRSAESAASAEDPSFGWQDRVAGGLTLRTVEGDHYSLLRDPAVAALAGLVAELAEEGGERS